MTNACLMKTQSVSSSRLRNHKPSQRVGLVSVLLGLDLEVVRVLVQRVLAGGDDGPEVWGLELVGLGESSHGSLQEVDLSGSRTLSLGVAILDTSHLEHSLGSWGSDDTSSSRSWDKSAHDGTGLSGDLAWNSVWLSNVRTPVTSSDGDNGEFGGDDGTSDGGSDFLGTLDTETNVTVEVTDGNGSLESGSLTGRRLFLDWGDGHDLVLQGWEEDVDNLELFDGQREQVDLLHRLDLSVLD